MTVTNEILLFQKALHTFKKAIMYFDAALNDPEHYHGYKPTIRDGRNISLKNLAMCHARKANYDGAASCYRLLAQWCVDDSWRVEKMPDFLLLSAVFALASGNITRARHSLSCVKSEEAAMGLLIGLTRCVQNKDKQGYDALMSKSADIVQQFDELAQAALKAARPM